MGSLRVLRDSVPQGVAERFFFNVSLASEGDIFESFQLAAHKLKSAGADWKVNISYRINPPGKHLAPLWSFHWNYNNFVILATSFFSSTFVFSSPRLKSLESPSSPLREVPQGCEDVVLQQNVGGSCRGFDPVR